MTRAAFHLALAFFTSGCITTNLSYSPPRCGLRSRPGHLAYCCEADAEGTLAVSAMGQELALEVVGLVEGCAVWRQLAPVEPEGKGRRGLDEVTKDERPAE